MPAAREAYLSSLLMAVTKMIGGVRIDSSSRISAAVSNPSISGICTSRRTTANLCRSISDSAAFPDSALKKLAGRFFRTFSVASRFSFRSSTIRIFGFVAARSFMRRLHLFPEYPLPRLHWFEQRPDGGEIEALAAAKAQEPAVPQAVCEQVEYASLQGPVE